MKQLVWFLAMATLLAGCGGNVAPQATPARATTSPRTALATGIDQIPFVTGYSEGLRAAQAEQKPMLVFFTAEWCHFCHKMAQEALADVQVVRLAEQFVCVVVDADAEPDACQKLRVEYFPTVQFLSPRGVTLNRVVGQQPAQEVLLAMRAALESVARRTQPTDRRPL
jgi:thiol:disulfide interchange protein